MARDRDEIPTSKVRRATSTTAALGPSGAKLAGSLIASLGRSPERAREVLEARHTEVAAQVVQVLASVLISLGKAIAPGLDPRMVAGELRERVLEELDFELEAQHQRTFARAYRGHPFVFVPEVVSSLSRRRVLVSEWVSGRRFGEILALEQEDRDRIGEIIVRF